MKKLLVVLLGAIALFTNTNAISSTSLNIKSSRNIDDERNIGSFNGIAATGPIDVIVTLGSKQGCRLEGDADALASITTEVKGNILIIRPQTSITSWAKKYENKKITAYVSANEIASLTMSGSGSMTINGKITTGNLATTLSGSGSLKLSADVDQYTAVISGSGALTITGTATEADVVVSSSGALLGKNLSVDHLSAKISGSGKVNMKVSKSINALISGSGSVNYSGNASVEQRVIGSGGVRKI